VHAVEEAATGRHLLGTPAWNAPPWRATMANTVCSDPIWRAAVGDVAQEALALLQDLRSLRRELGAPRNVPQRELDLRTCPKQQLVQRGKRLQPADLGGGDAPSLTSSPACGCPPRQLENARATVEPMGA